MADTTSRVPRKNRRDHPSRRDLKLASTGFSVAPIPVELRATRFTLAASKFRPRSIPDRRSESKILCISSDTNGTKKIAVFWPVPAWDKAQMLHALCITIGRRFRLSVILLRPWPEVCFRLVQADATPRRTQPSSSLASPADSGCPASSDW